MLGLGSQAQLGLGIAIVLQDQFSQTSRKVVSSFEAMKGASNSMMDQVAKDYQSYQMKVAATAGALTYGMYNMAKQGAEFTRGITQTMVIGSTELGKTREQLKGIRDQVADELGLPTEQVESAMLQDVQSGVTGSLKDLVKFQAAASTILSEPLGGEGGVAQGLLGAISAFGLEKNLTNIKRVTDALVGAANASQASVRDIGQSFQYAGFTMRQYGMSVEQAAAFTALLAQSGIKGSSAGVAMNNMMIQLGKSVNLYATKQQRNAWTLLGIDPKTIQSLLNEHKLFEIIQLIQNTVKARGFTQQQAMADIIQPLLQVRGEKALLGGFSGQDPKANLFSMMQEVLKAQQGQGATMTQGLAVAKDPYADFVRVQNQWNTFKEQFVETIAPELLNLAKGLKWLNDVLKSFMSSGLGSLITQFVAVLAPFIAIVSGLKVAAMGIAFAFKGWGEFKMLGGFMNILKGQLGNAGTSIFGSVAGGLGLAQNKLGRWQVAEGHTWTHPTTGKVYPGGRFVPTDALGKSVNKTGFGNLFSFGKMGGVTSAAAEGESVLGVLGTISSTLMEFLPELLALVGLFEVFTDLFSTKQSADDRMFNSAQGEFAKDINRQLWGLLPDPGHSPTALANKGFGGGNRDLIVNLNLNGVPQQSQNIPLDDPNKPFHQIDMQFIP